MSILDKLLTSVHRVTKEIELIPAVELLLVRGRVQHEQVTTLQKITEVILNFLTVFGL